MILTPCPQEVLNLRLKRTDTMRGAEEAAKEEEEDEGDEGTDRGRFMWRGLALVAVNARVVGGVGDWPLLN